MNVSYALYYFSMLQADRCGALNAHCLREIELAELAYWRAHNGLKHCADYIRPVEDQARIPNGLIETIFLSWIMRRMIQ